MSVQRRRGQPVVLYRSKVIQDSRGNDVVTVDREDPHLTTAAAIPQRSSKAEVPGQQMIDVVRLIVKDELDGVTLWSRVEYRGEEWDLVTPPSYHHGTRQTRHWSIDIRRRP